MDATPSTRRRRHNHAGPHDEHYLRHAAAGRRRRPRRAREELANLAAPYAAGELVEFLDTLAVQDQDMASDDDAEKVAA